jgi:hypothetical protein
MINLSGKTSDRPSGKRNLSRGEYLLVGPYDQNAGNAHWSDWTLGPHTLTLSGGNCHGIRVRQTVNDDYVKIDPANPPSGVFMAGAAIDKNRVWQRKERHPIIADLLDFYADREGKNSRKCWQVFWQKAKATSATDRNVFEGELDAGLILKDLDISGGRMLDTLTNELSTLLETTLTWTQAVDWIKALSPDELAGEETVVVEEYL